MPKEPTYVTVKVVGAMPIRDAVTREDVPEGQTVRLDPAKTIIKALVQAGAVELIDTKAGPKADKGA